MTSKTKTDKDTIRKNGIISALILIQIENGKTVEQAINTVLGEGIYTQISNAIYDLLRKEIQ